MSMIHQFFLRVCGVALGVGLAASAWQCQAQVVYPGGNGPGSGKRIVLMAGDEEYRSEEGLPMLGKILSQRHGFHCTVLFSINPMEGTIDPNNSTNVPGMSAVAAADLVICQFRFRELPDSDMKYFVDHLESGKPMIAIRTSTHAFQYAKNPKSPHAKYDWRSKEWPGGFGQQVLGDTWVSHHGNHGKESTRGLIDGTHAKHPVLNGVADIWGPSDVYGIVKLKPADQILVHGLTLKGMQPEDAPLWRKSLMPLVWIREYRWPNDKVGRTLTSTLGAATDLVSEDLRRMFINACYWLTALPAPARADASIVGEFQPSNFGFGTFRKGVKPADHELK